MPINTFQTLPDMALLRIRDAYKIDPLEKYSFVYSPSHRKDAKANRNNDQILVGISGRRNVNKKLKLRRPDGKHYSFHPASMYFRVTVVGEIYVELWPFSHCDNNYFWDVKKYLRRNYAEFSAILNSGTLFYDTNDENIHLETVERMLRDENYFSIMSPRIYFPIEKPEAIEKLIQSFIFLFPILDICHDLAEGIKPSFLTHFKNLKSWSTNYESITSTIQNNIIPQLPELDSYRFVRAGLWYQVLMQDNWTCCSCKRSAKEHGIVLHVDHKLPRSLGGKDELENLQTLCLKCNIGKSNKDTTDLRA